MKNLIGILAIIVAQGTMSTDDSDVSQAEASLSGVSQEIQLQEEEVQIEDEVDDGYIESEEQDEANPPPSQ
ncbi:MAG: hypothetical protein NDI69_03395 [Bacteriovoracaceae bacterium]|nr:hypothetical protein [Bacteriovoracaceae bacterium]